MNLSSANIHFDIIMLSETWLDSDIGNFDIKVIIVTIIIAH